MLWVIKIAFTLRRFFWTPKTHAKIYGSENIFNFSLKNFVYLNQRKTYLQCRNRIQRHMTYNHSPVLGLRDFRMYRLDMVFPLWLGPELYYQHNKILQYKMRDVLTLCKLDNYIHTFWNIYTVIGYTITDCVVLLFSSYIFWWRVFILLTQWMSMVCWWQQWFQIVYMTLKSKLKVKYT